MRRPRPDARRHRKVGTRTPPALTGRVESGVLAYMSALLPAVLKRDLIVAEAAQRRAVRMISWLNAADILVLLIEVSGRDQAAAHGELGPRTAVATAASFRA